jgi:hypothetical protein
MKHVFALAIVAKILCRFQRTGRSFISPGPRFPTQLIQDDTAAKIEAKSATPHERSDPGKMLFAGERPPLNYKL